MYPELDNAMQFRLDDIHEIKDYFIAEVHDRETMSKRPNRYIAAFDCVEKILLVLSGRNGSVSLVFFAAVVGVSLGITSVSFGLFFSFSNGISKTNF